MTLPTIRHGQAHNGRYYAEFVPDGMFNAVRIYGDTMDEAERGAFEFLAEHDAAVRGAEKTNATPSVESMADDIRALNERYAVEATNDDPVAHPAHYERFPVEPINLTEQLMFNRGNAVKYLTRAGHKNPATEVEDLRKALWYVEREIMRVQALHGAPDHSDD